MIFSSIVLMLFGNGVFYPYEYFGLKARIALAVFLIGAILPSSVIIR